MTAVYYPGDIITFYGGDVLAKAIEWITSGPSHVGIVSTLDDNPVLIESTSLCKRPCLVQGKVVKGVQVHHIDDRIADYQGRATLYRLLPPWRLCHYEQERLREWLFWFVSNHATYDYGRAVLSSTHYLKYLTWAYPDPDTQFCSELCAGALMAIGKFPLSDPSSYTPGRLVKTLEKIGLVCRT